MDVFDVFMKTSYDVLIVYYVAYMMIKARILKDF